MSEQEYRTPYQRLREVDVSEHIERKNGLAYLSWVYATDYIKCLYPNSYAIIFKTQDGVPYFTDGKTCWVNVEYHIIDEKGKDWVEKEPAFPIMDYRNQSILVDKVTSMNVNTAIQRGITKCIARHGLGFYIYAGEDIPFDSKEDERITSTEASKIQSLYTRDEIKQMLTNLKKKNLAEITKEEAQKMISARERNEEETH